MKTHQKQYLPHGNHPRSVQANSFYRCTPCWCQSKYQGTIIAAYKVINPVLTARMVQRCHLTCQGIHGLGAGVFVIIATLAGQRQIVSIPRAPLASGDNVFY